MKLLERLGVRVYFRIWGFPKMQGTFLGVPRIRTIAFWGLHCGSLILGNYHLGFTVEFRAYCTTGAGIHTEWGPAGQGSQASITYFGLGFRVATLPNFN